MYVGIISCKRSIYLKYVQTKNKIFNKFCHLFLKLYIYVHINSCNLYILSLQKQF